MKYCPYCGTQLQDDMVFCHKCGKRFVGTPEDAPEAMDQENEHVDEEKNSDDVQTWKDALKYPLEKMNKEDQKGLQYLLFVLIILVVYLIITKCFLGW